MSERRPELDGLRGLAVLLVLLSHAANRGLLLAPGLDLRGVGRTGVFLFFVLSSALLTDQLLGHGTRGLLRPATLGHYALRRALRILPAYALTLLALTALGGLTRQHALEHLVFVRAEAHLWTVPVELLSYLVLPPLALALSIVGRPRLQLALVVLFALAGRVAFPPDYPARAPDFRPDVAPFFVIFAGGVAVAVAQRGSILNPPTMRALGWMGLAGLGSLTPWFAELVTGEPIAHTRFHLWFGTLTTCAAGVVLAVFARAEPLLVRAFGWAPLAALGRARYSVYLLHALPLDYVTQHGPLGARGAWLYLGASLVLGGAAYAVVERPFLRRRA